MIGLSLYDHHMGELPNARVTLLMEIEEWAGGTVPPPLKRMKKSKAATVSLYMKWLYWHFKLFMYPQSWTVERQREKPVEMVGVNDKLTALFPETTIFPKNCTTHVVID